MAKGLDCEGGEVAGGGAGISLRLHFVTTMIRPVMMMPPCGRDSTQSQYLPGSSSLLLPISPFELNFLYTANKIKNNRKKWLKISQILYIYKKRSKSKVWRAWPRPTSPKVFLSI